MPTREEYLNIGRSWGMCGIVSDDMQNMCAMAPHHPGDHFVLGYGPPDELGETHEIWMSLNCGVPDGGCSCSRSPRPQGGFLSPFEVIGNILGKHLAEELGNG